MRLFNDAKGYATEQTAIEKLEKVAAAAGIGSLFEMHWMVTVTAAGKFVPVVRITGTRYSHLITYFASKGVSVM